MNRAGPPLESLIRRIVDTPQDFLAEPKTGNKGIIHVDAVAGDLATLFGDTPPIETLARFMSGDPQNTRHHTPNGLALALLTCWLYADPWFLRQRITPLDLLQALHSVATELAPYASATDFHGDPERREELARTALARLGYRPANETPEQTQDRLANVSGAERQRVVNAARAAEQRAREARKEIQRAREIREALARKAAEESADKWTRD